MRISDWSSDVCSSDLVDRFAVNQALQCLLQIRLFGERKQGVQGGTIILLPCEAGIQRPDAQREPGTSLGIARQHLRNGGMDQPRRMGAEVVKQGLRSHGCLTQGTERSEEHTYELQS